MMLMIRTEKPVELKIDQVTTSWLICSMTWVCRVGRPIIVNWSQHETILH